MAHTCQSKFLTYSILNIHWRQTHLLLSLDHPKTRPLILNSAKIFYSTQADFLPLTIHYFSFSYFDWTNQQHKYQYTIKRCETVSQR